MIKITNGVNILEVTNGAFKDIYSKQGYKEFEDKVSEAKEEDTVMTPKDKKLNELIEKPIAQWNKTEVKGFAEENEIDIKGTKNINEAKAIIKEFINS